MPRAERSQDIGEIFRQKVESILKPLRYEILGSKYTLKCKCEYHNVAEHTVDILARHLHAGESLRRRIIPIESKKTLPASGRIEEMVIDLANKMDCLYKHLPYSEINEGLFFADTDVSLRVKDAFDRASRKIASSRDMAIGLVSGPRFRVFEALSAMVQRYSSSSSITIINALRKPDQDIGSPCPLNIDQISRMYLCALRPTEFKISVFKIDDQNYTSENFLEDMEWIKNYSGIFDQIHAGEGFTDDAIRDVQAAGLGIGIVDHSLKRTFATTYLNYQRQGQ